MVSRARKSSRILFIAAGACLWLSCTMPGAPGPASVLMHRAIAPTPRPEKGRVVHVKVAADPSFAQGIHWRDNAANLISTASDLYYSWFNIRFRIDTMVIVQVDSAGCGGLMLDNDCLMRQIPRGNADIVICFSKEGSPADYSYAGYTLYRQGYVVIKQGSGASVSRGYKASFLALVHEIGHVFGAVHIYPDPDPNVRYVMNPSLSDQVYDKQGKDSVLLFPDFHPANRAIIAALINRPFANRHWGAERWPAIRAAYDAMRREYGNFSIASGGTLRNYELNALYQNEPYSYLSTWASACGLDSLALIYCDSFKIVSNAMISTCNTTDHACLSRMCRGFGCATAARHEREMEIERSYLWQKANLLLSCGKIHDADAIFNAFMAGISILPYDTREKFRGSYAEHKRLLEPTSETGGANSKPSADSLH